MSKQAYRPTLHKCTITFRTQYDNKLFLLNGGQKRQVAIQTEYV